MIAVRILHLTPPYGFGGVHSFLFNYYKYMDRREFQFDLLSRSSHLTVPDAYAGCRCGMVELPPKACPEREKRERLIRIMGSGYDALHLHTSSWGGRGFYLEEIAGEVGIPRVIVHSHSTNIADLNLDESTRQARYQRHQELKTQFREDMATDFWACSGLAADWLFGSQIPRDRIRIIKNAIDVERYRFSPERRERVRSALGIGESPLLGTVGGFTYLKNPEFLIDLFAGLHREHKDAKLLMVGDGELRPAMEKRIADQGLTGSVIMPGWTADVENYLCAMDCFLFPSRFEGFGIAPLEALAAGLPCVVSEAIPEELEFTERLRRMLLDRFRWAAAVEEMLRMGKSIDRRTGADVVRAAGYDVRLQAQVLERLYRGEEGAGL